MITNVAGQSGCVKEVMGQSYSKRKNSVEIQRNLCYTEQYLTKLEINKFLSWKANYRYYCKRHKIYGRIVILVGSVAVGFITGYYLMMNCPML